MKSALVVIDAQRIYTNPDSDLYCADVENTIENINALIKYFADDPHEIVFVRHIHKVDGSDIGRLFSFDGEGEGDFNFKAGTEEVEYDSRLNLPAKHNEIIKTRYSAFENTPLDDFLRARGVEKIVICGFMTNFCCESTARCGLDKDYLVEFVAEATGTPGTEQMDQRKIREVVSELLGAGFARITVVSDYIS